MTPQTDPRRDGPTVLQRCRAWVRECVSGAVSFTPPPERTCSVCRQSLRPFLFASGRLGPQYIWIHTDGSILDEHHRPFPIWTLLGGDGGA